MDGRGRAGSLGDTGVNVGGRWPTVARTRPAGFTGGGRALAVGTAKHDQGGFGDEVTKFICMAAKSFMAPMNTLPTRQADGSMIAVPRPRLVRRGPRAPPPPNSSS